MGYLLPGKLLSFVGQDVKVQHQEDGQVFFYLKQMFKSCGSLVVLFKMLMEDKECMVCTLAESHRSAALIRPYQKHLKPF